MNARLKAFTLIELLIVVAIIAILAAIAVPNFLEAQSRAKVSRSRSDMRSIATALEAYRIDNNSALPASAMSAWWCERWGYWERVTSPVAYMTSVPEDQYYKSLRTWGDDYFYFFPVYDKNIMNALLHGGTAPGMWSRVLTPVGGEARGWLTTYIEPAFSLWGRAGSNYMIRGFGPISVGADQVYVEPYDPTNGTISRGNLYYYN
ncbi:MAG TPA: prepilin-type N-terminal cleavage/methylation domain-containing protein [Candidatus Sumerlaeota bacterium]|nr:prepilin-type N-terminal cleavage/methylation domain-containing protein [Candidatus Sumerlaeota bacterium]HOR27300.1 prepilin-type N-terminal cleavage/methylation domain-containing protein [Candidatus Sumerlaeota bacterium]